jgi:hypothetical protein
MAARGQLWQWGLLVLLLGVDAGNQSTLKTKFIISSEHILGHEPFDTHLPRVMVSNG